MTDDRRASAKRVRDAAAQLAYDREHPVHRSNGDEQRYSGARYAMNFTKGLDHDPATGLINDPEAFRAFRAAIDNGFVDTFTSRVPVSEMKQRKWEAPTAGLVFELEGPDAEAVTMAPPPALGSCELAYEMAEVYELALLRDVPLADFKVGSASAELKASTKRLNKIGYDLSGKAGRPRKNVGGEITCQTAFRGSSPGVEHGPYLSQLMLLGNKSVAGEDEATDGRVRYGAIRANQRVPTAMEGVDFMTAWDEWLAVQNGKDTQTGNEADIFGPSTGVTRRFISTPRDLATFVHYDALYEAYLNACLLLLGMQTPKDPEIAAFDPAFDKLSGGGKLHADTAPRNRQAGGFALWGGPHILTLVTEVATRALKAVRYQKFNTHCRLRPEALAARIERAGEIEQRFPSVCKGFSELETSIGDTVKAIVKKNTVGKTPGTKLLPMAFQEGSPMHPSYGAGHATVAGACVTMLKAFFDTSAVLVSRCTPGGSKGAKTTEEVFFTRTPMPGDQPVAFVPDTTGKKLQPVHVDCYLTLEGELNKLAANISIGRNMAGVHYFSDYYDSLRMGEKIALGILEEQALCYPLDPFVVSVPTFDGPVRRIGRR
ncbi:MAG: vanadium-dependent haloperoxidase [Acidobacteria bacterium]|nr:vanadium-dependent haloperoxidase [Acidobacteriota bacterium]